MNPGDKIPKLLAPEPIDKRWSGREAWRGWRIIAELAAAPEPAKRVRRVSSDCGSAPLPRAQVGYGLTEALAQRGRG